MDGLPPPGSWPDVPFDLGAALVLVVRRGSEAHGTWRPPSDPDATDDRDLYGVAIPPSGYYLGLGKWEHAESIKGPWDVVLDEFRKFVGLLMNQNPNVLSTLWCDDEDVLVATPAGRLLRERRALFRHRELAHRSFVGYAFGQLKRMTSFGAYKGYMGAKRKAFVERFGWDTKNGAHLVRILRMGEEYLRTGELTVRRPDADEIVAIKRGEVGLATVQAEADRLFAACHAAAAASVLPEDCDRAAIEATMLECFRLAGIGGTG